MNEHLTLMPKPRLIQRIHDAQSRADYWHQKWANLSARIESLPVADGIAKPDPIALAFARTPKDPDAMQHCRDLLDALDLGERTRQRLEHRGTDGRFTRTDR